MNGPNNLDRRQVLAGGGALIVSFSLSDAFAQDQAAPAPAPAPAEHRQRHKVRHQRNREARLAREPLIQNHRQGQQQINPQKYRRRRP